jgi:hypothetical protein
MSTHLVPIQTADRLSLDELAEVVKVEHAAVAEALASAVMHAFSCGEALLVARSRFTEDDRILGRGRTGWTGWLASVGLDQSQASIYMRLTHYREHIPAEAFDGFIDNAGSRRAASINSLSRYVKGLPQIQPFQGHRYRPTSPEVKAEAARLRDEGLDLQQIADLLGFSKATINVWLNPEARRRQKASAAALRVRRREDARALAEHKRRQNVRAAARNAPPALADLYAASEKMQDLIGRASTEATDPRTREALGVAGTHYRQMRDAVVRALSIDFGASAA